MTVREAGNYLNRYKGLDFLAEHYEAEHLSATVYRICPVCVTITAEV